MFLQIMGMTLMVIGLVGFLVAVGVILYRMIRAENASRQPSSQSRPEPSGEVER